MKADDLYEQVAAAIVAAIEEGAGEWRMPWKALADGGTAVNVNGRPYRGLNALWLPIVSELSGWSSNVWGTYKAWGARGGQVRKGEKGTHVLFWKQLQRDEIDPDTGEVKPRKSLVARTYVVFAAEQVEGSERTVELRRGGEGDELSEPERIARAEEYFAAIPATVRHGGGRAYYQRAGDFICLPELAAFEHAEHYYSTRAHELTHWTGHESRLARTFGARFGDDAYAVEELTAELGAAFVSAQLGLLAATRQDHAAYLSSWCRVLKAEPRTILTVASKAQAACDLLNKLAGWVAAEVDDESESERAAA